MAQKTKIKSSYDSSTLPQNRITLKSYKVPGEVFADIERLNKDFLREFKKGANVQVVYGLGGKLDENTHFLTIWHEGTPEDIKEVEWFKSKVVTPNNI